jgi:hypothetical protein
MSKAKPGNGALFLLRARTLGTRISGTTTTGTTGTGTFTVTFAQTHADKVSPLELHVAVPDPPSPQEHDVAVPDPPSPQEHATCELGVHWRGNARYGVLAVGSALAAREIVVSAAASVSEGKSLAMGQLLASSGFMGFSSQNEPMPRQSIRVRR